MTGRQEKGEIEMFTKKQVETEKSNGRKMVVFKHVELLNGYYQDTAALTDSNYSATIEDVLLKNILTGNAATDYYIENIYKFGLKECFIALMQNLSAGINFKASEQNSYPLIKLATNILSRPFSSSIDPEYSHYYDGHFPSNCKQVAKILEHEAENRELSFEEKMELEDNLALLNNTTKDGVDFVPYNYFSLVLKNWTALGNNSFTFRMLFDVVALSDNALWDKPEHRINAIECIKDVTKSWDIY